METDLNEFDNSTFDKGAGKIRQINWYFFNSLFFKSSIILPIKFKLFLLKIFGAKIGKGIIIKPCVNIKYPWKLKIDDFCWIGENVWIDNLDFIEIGKNVCLSQGALLLTGNHDYTKINFEYRNAPIYLKDGVWIGAKAIVCPGVVCESHSILTVGSVATSNLDKFSVYQGNPAKKIKSRIIEQ